METFTHNPWLILMAIIWGSCAIASLRSKDSEAMGHATVITICIGLGYLFLQMLHAK